MKLDSLKGIGPKKAKALESLGIHSVRDLLFHFPRYYEDRSRLCRISDLEPGKRVLFYGVLQKVGRLIHLRQRHSLQKATVHDGEDFVTVVWHNQPYLSSQLRVEKGYLFYGSLSEKNREVCDPMMRQMDFPEGTFAQPGWQESLREDLPKDFTGILPYYDLCKGITQKDRRKATSQAIRLFPMEEDPFRDFLFLFPLLKDTFRALHFPESVEELRKAQADWQKREALGFLLAQKELNRQKKTRNSPALHPISWKKYEEGLPFTLTEGQKSAIREMSEDLYRTEPMNRLLQGDVGSGKTVVALALAYQVLENGYQVCLMAPTELLARQHLETAKKIFRYLPRPIYFLAGSSSPEERETLQQHLDEEEACLVVGTHALFQETVRFTKMALVITDEQHRFGVRQRQRLQQKAMEPNLLVLSATPIPRTLHLVDLGDLSLTRLLERPAGRKGIETYVVDRRYEERAYRFISRLVQQGQKAYIVCPRIEEKDDDLAYWSIEAVSKRVGSRIAPGKVGVLYGSLPAEEKAIIMDRFHRGDLQVLIATTVVEVGVDEKLATVMLILAAERFGLSQLHQLRGRVGRGSLPSYCILLAHHLSKTAIGRLRIMEETDDGFRIARKDLELRGAGSRFGTEQHGLEQDLFFQAPPFSETRDKVREELIHRLGEIPTFSALGPACQAWCSRFLESYAEMSLN